MHQDRSQSNMGMEGTKERIEGLQQVTENDNNNEKQSLLKPDLTKKDGSEEEQEFTEEELAKLRNVMSLGFKKQDTTSGKLQVNIFYLNLAQH